MKEKLNTLFTNIKAGKVFKWSDLALLIGFLPFTIFLIFGQEFMQYTDPSMVGCPVWLMTIAFVISIGGWITYLYLERDNMPHLAVSITFLVLALLNVIVIICQPTELIETVICRTNESLIPGLNFNDPITLTIPISEIHKAFNAMDITLILFFIYIGLFIFPKRFPSLAFIEYLGYAVFVLVIAVILGGYVMDAAKYPMFIKCLLGKAEGEDIYKYTVESFIIHRNAYGMVMMLGIIFAFINHSLNKQWYNYLLVGFFFVNMIFSLCKTGLIISLLMIAVYVIYRLIVTMKEHKKRNIILLSTFAAIAVIGVGVVGLSYVTKSKFLGFIYSMIHNDDPLSSTLYMRSRIWDNTYQLLRDGNWLIGRGFGIINLILQPMNVVNGDKVFPTHNSFINLLAEGGILYLVAYLVLTGFMIYVVVKDFKKNPGLTVAMSLGYFAFFIYSFIETIHYLAYIFMFPLLILYFLKDKKETLTE